MCIYIYIQPRYTLSKGAGPGLGRVKCLNGLNEPMFTHKMFKHFHPEPAQRSNGLNWLNV